MQFSADSANSTQSEVGNNPVTFSQNYHCDNPHQAMMKCSFSPQKHQQVVTAERLGGVER